MFKSKVVSATSCKCHNVDLHYDQRLFGGIQCLDTNSLPGWAKEVTCAFCNSSTAWEPLWPRLNDLHGVNLTKTISSFYYAEYMMAVFKGEKAEAAAETQRRIVRNLTAPLKEYMHFVLMSELRHTKQLQATCSASPEDNEWMTFYGWGQITKAIGRDNAAKHALSLFSKPWRDAYGGSNYKKIAQVLVYAEERDINGVEFTDKLFVDRVFSLEHNTGTVFSKLYYLFPGFDHELIETILKKADEGDMDFLALYAFQ